jgi:hypothetical protein
MRAQEEWQVLAVIEFGGFQAHEGHPSINARAREVADSGGDRVRVVSGS